MSFDTRLLSLSLVVIAFSTFIYLSLDIDRHRNTVYLADISSKSGTGTLKIAFYAYRYRTYLNDSSLSFEKDDWNVVELVDSAILTPRFDHARITLKSYGAPLYVSLIRGPEGGTAIVKDGLGKEREIDLKAESESLHTISIGGDASIAASIATSEHYPTNVHFKLYIFIFLILTLLVLFRRYNTFGNAEHNPTPYEIVGYAAPLIVSPVLLQLTFWPASVSIDGGLQWMEAVEPGHLNPALIIPATLLFRVFSKLSANPAIVVLAQILFGAIGVALILYEIRKRGVSRGIVQISAIVIAILPQYPTFITNLSKDAWNCIGILLLTFGSMALSRHVVVENRIHKAIIVPLVATILVGALLAGIMRPNTLPAIVAFMVLLTIYFRKQTGIRFTGILFICYLVTALILPSLIISHSEEFRADRSSGTQPPSPTKESGIPLQAFALFYEFHLFAAAVNSDVTIDPTDAEIFFKIAPPATWKEYDCAYVDKTQVAINKMKSMDDSEYSQYLAKHQNEMTRIVLKLILENPVMLFDRQACVSGLLWYIGYRTNPFQVNATIGFDSVPENFLEQVGENRSLLGQRMREFIIGYMAWSESWTHLWIFWRPFLYTALGIFAVLTYTISRRSVDVLIVSTLPLLLTLTLAVFIVFPAYRYQYPATLLFMLFFLLSFGRGMQNEA